MPASVAGRGARLRVNPSAPRLRPDADTPSGPEGRPGEPPVTAAGRDGLELLRVAAMAMLILYHAALLQGAGEGWLARGLARISGAGWIGTDLMLALAGFLAVGSRARAAGTIPWLARRAGRVLPPVVVFLLLYLYALPLVLGALGGHRPLLDGLAVARSNQAWLFGMATNVKMVLGGRVGGALEPLLTLAVGVQLTLLVAPLLPRPGRRAAPLVGLVALAACAVALRVAWRGGDPWRIYSFPLTRADAFLAGIAAAWVSSRPRARAWIDGHLGLLAGAAGALLVAAAAVTRGLSVEPAAASRIAYPALGAAWALLVLVTARAPRVPLRWAAPAGALAYGVYLVKLPVLFAVRDALPAGAGGPAAILVLAAAGGLATVLVALGFHLAVERPLAGAAARLRGRPEPLAARGEP